MASRCVPALKTTSGFDASEMGRQRGGDNGFNRLSVDQTDDDLGPRPIRHDRERHLDPAQKLMNRGSSCHDVPLHLRMAKASAMPEAVKPLACLGGSEAAD